LYEAKMRVIDSLGNIKQSILGIAPSGSITSGALANNSVVSGSIGSGQVFRFRLASGAANSGHIGSGSVVGAAGGGTSNIASGSILQNSLQPTRSNIGSGAIQSGHIASGQIGTFHMLYVISPAAGRPVTAGTMYSAAQSNLDNAQYQAALSSGLNFEDGLAFFAGETISGGRAVTINQSGLIGANFLFNYVYIAMAKDSTRMPAFGVVMDNVLSGLPVTVYQHGVFQFTSGMANMSAAISGYGSYSGFLGRTLVVGLSGQIATFISGGQWVNTNTVTQIQRLGTVINSGGFIANVDQVVWSGSSTVGLHWNLGI
jgi:hypothetical protein